MPTKIKDLKHLKEICTNEDNEPVDCFINLGGLRSSKGINYIDKDVEGKWYVFHEIDGEDEYYNTDKDMLTSTNIGAALKAGNLYAY